MKASETQHTVRAWSFRDALLEWHQYPPGPAGTVPPHVHDEYQFCLSVDFPGEYRYRGAGHIVPVGSLSVIHPGEVHSPRDPTDRSVPSTFRMMYASPALLATVTADITGRASGLPVFTFPIISDDDLGKLFLAFHEATDQAAPRLELDSRLLTVLARFVVRHGDTRVTAATVGRERRPVRLVREYLDANYAANVSLDQLAHLANLSPFHLTRVFAAEIGLPPHAYQVGVRVERAKALLLRGDSVARAAAETGFADQSHLTRHFRRLVGTPPGRYAPERKNVQDKHN